MVAAVWLGIAASADAATSLGGAPLAAPTAAPSSAAPTGTTSASSIPAWCRNNTAGATYTGIAPYTIHFFAKITCDSPVTSLVGVATLNTVNGDREATGNTCSRTTGTCQSAGTYSNTIYTMPFITHVLHWHYTVKVPSGYSWVDDGTGSNCRGYGSRTLVCDWDVDIRTPIPVVGI
ncbi:MAG: hypothetical protein QOG09_1608 [Solirubrobacterales bacterium]|jgi:hypothetical protein|nr:hypothetical protein [Solirubrobacterales bacterium]MDX6652315.1 hypothetical protein [Solirubrobacterales bacterium]MDX6663506.1 hypothetical protein [Solirubrobacterales bacterium]